MKKPSHSKLLADENLGLQVAHTLAQEGLNIVAIADVARGANDTEVLTRANSEKRILITTDKDFGYLIFKEQLATYGIILIRLKEESVQNLTDHLLGFLLKFEDEIQGKFIVITEKKVRIRTLS